MNAPTLVCPVIVLLCCSASLPAAGEVKPVNVLFIAADDLRVEVGCYGGTPALTPHLDRLAGRGMKFRRAYCQQALCNPSRASLLTGLRPDTLRLWNLTNHFRDTQPEVVTLPQLFLRRGWHTENIGKVFHNWRTEIKGDPDSWSVPAVMHFATHGSDLPQTTGPPPPSLSKTSRVECRDVADDAYFDGRIATRAVAALRQRKQQGKPFFLAVGFWKPHLPFNAPKKYWDLYRRDAIQLPAHPSPPQDVPPLALHNGRELLGSNGRGLTDNDVRELRHGYYAAISYLDAQIGRVLDELERLELVDSTLVVFWSDHGFHLGEHQLWCKTSNFELDARVPLIIAPPKYARGGAETSALAELLDLYPTIADLCGLSAPGHLEGASLRPLLEDPQATVKPSALTQHPRPAYYKDAPDAMGYSMRTSRYRYTEWRDWKTGGVVATELYDHQHDTAETRNVAASHPDTVSQLSKALSQRYLLHCRSGGPTTASPR